MELDIRRIHCPSWVPGRARFLPHYIHMLVQEKGIESDLKLHALCFIVQWSIKSQSVEGLVSGAKVVPS